MHQKLKPLKNNIVFQFMDEVTSKGQFVEAMSTRGLFMTASHDDSAKRPRWCRVVAVGPDCMTVKPDDLILLPSLRWSESAKMSGQSYWKTNEDEVVAYLRDGEPLIVVNDWVLFHYNRDGFTKLSSGLFVKSINETPSGEVKDVGPKVLDKLANTKVYYDGALFSNLIYYNRKDYGFLRVTDLLGYSPL